MALGTRRARADAEAAGWGPFSSNRSNGCRDPPEGAARAGPQVSGGPAATARSGARGMGGGGPVAERGDGAFRGRGRGGVDGSGVGGSAPGMLSLSPATRIFVALQPVDMRAGFNRLYALVETRLHQPPLSGHLFVFTNRLRNRVKILYFDGSGLWVCAKRLERGTFGWPSGEGDSRSIRPEELSVLLHGLEVTPRRHWFRR
jgi:transposase